MIVHRFHASCVAVLPPSLSFHPFLGLWRMVFEQRTEFEGPGGWPFETNGSEDHAKVWPADKGRFALYADGHEEVPGASQGGGGAAASQ